VCARLRPPPLFLGLTLGLLPALRGYPSELLGDEPPALVKLKPVRGQQARRHPLSLGKDREEDVFRADIVHAHPAGLAHSEIHHALRARAHRQVYLAVARRSDAGKLLDLFNKHLRGEVIIRQYLRDEAVVVVEQPQKDMLRPDHLMAHPQGLFMRKLEDALAPFRKIVPHYNSLPCVILDFLSSAILSRSCAAYS